MSFFLGVKSNLTSKSKVVNGGLHSAGKLSPPAENGGAPPDPLTIPTSHPTEATICKWPGSPVSNGRFFLCTDHVCVRSATSPLWVSSLLLFSPTAHFSNLPLQDSHNNFKRYARYVFYLVFLIPSPLNLSCSTLPPPSFPVAPLGLFRLDSKRFSAEFQKHLSVNKKDFSTVEYLLRKGHRQLEMYASPGIRNIS
jgi:hypothetical protein